MATPKQIALQKELASQLQGQGYCVRLTDWPRRITWFKPTGEAMPNLPADPWHMERYLARGFIPDLPKMVKPEVEPAPETAQDQEPVALHPTGVHPCPKCGAELRAEKCAWCKDEEE